MISGYIPPPALPSTSPSAAAAPAPAPAPPPTDMVAICTISVDCQREAVKIGDTPPRPLNCNYDDFECICGRTNVMAHNTYFSSGCILRECTNVDSRKAFMSRYMEGCTNITTELTDIPADWLPFAPSPQLTSTGRTLRTTEIKMSMTLSQPTSTDLTTLSQDTTMRQTTVPPDTAMLTSTNAADIQLPICGVSRKCLKKQKDHSPSCGPDDLPCICKSSNSLAKNTQFDQQCVFDECHGDIGLREFLQSLVYNCKKVDRELIDIPDRWKIYIPESATTSSTLSTATVTAPPTTSPSGLPASTFAHTQPFHIADGAIAGIAVGVLLTVGILVAMAMVYWKARKKTKELTRKNAILVDRTSEHGASARIDKVMSGRSMTSLTTTADGATLVPASRRETQDGHGIHGQEGGQEYHGKEGYGLEAPKLETRRY
ncbi:uncharacterized protein K460DRAFT_421306 [Cucurbitaria berberidis CBS 394.84]|uniref:Extracellular membrane protein CFEM domain-containing protein n=1 Tax=Cucurbitaria berberidis CBS 394.84 TaxID=1168544 RepID=A0A9P4L3H8_9PLEO|nr:uncharacterized protein K460DRAFT_421306 [Cucurbitaria berberidis CBS 394.84]KAF1840334.1 hypothetical protein K460DRAFT_421306 [Cucurbitaria berberidis CBS 394.84]